jgi:membrane protease YdiL (CAAX protease family)
VPAEPLQEVARIAEAYGIVATVALSAGVGLWPLARFTRQGWAVVPRKGPERRTGFEVAALFLLNVVFVSVMVAVLQKAGFFREVYGPTFPEPLPSRDALGMVGGGAGASSVVESAAPFQTVRTMWASLFAVPLLYATAVGFAVAVNRKPRFEFADWYARVWAGIAAWAVLTPVVFGVYAAADRITTGLGGEPDRHPMTKLGVGESPFDRVVFALAVCVAAPLAEELLFRGILVRWTAGRAYRGWIVLVVAGILAAAGTGDLRSPAVAFTASLGVGVLAIRKLGGKPFAFRGAGIWASVALFAAAHSAVWPTPVPLFVLGLGLGWLCLRTRGILACVVAHGLFNAVSFVYLLRGGTG